MLILNLSLYGHMLLEPCFTIGYISDKCVTKANETGHVSRRYSYCSLLQKSGQEIAQGYQSSPKPPTDYFYTELLLLH